MIDGVEEALHIRFDHPVVSPKWPRDRQLIHRVQGSHGWPIPIATTPEILLVDGGEEARDRQLQPLVRHGRYPYRSELAVPCGEVVPSDPCGPVALPLQSLHQGADVFVQVLLVGLRAHRIDAVGGVLADLAPAVLEPRLVAPPIEVAKPRLLLALGLLC